MKSLHEDKVRIKTFELRLMNSGEDKDQIVDRWLKVAINSSVEEISLLCGWEKKDGLSFPMSAFEAKSLKALRLEFNIKFPDGLFGIPISLVWLKRLDLSSVEVSEEQLHYIVSKWPNLEELLLTNNVNGGWESKRTINHHNVKCINIRHSTCDQMAYDVEAPRLERVTLRTPQFFPFRLTATTNLRFLGITSGSTPALEEFLRDVIPNLPMLESLHLRSRFLKKLKVRSRSMRVINWDFDESPESVEIDAPNLRRIYFSSLNWYPIRCWLFNNLSEMLRKLPTCQILYIKCCALYTKKCEQMGLQNFEDPKMLDHLMVDVDSSCPISFSALATSLFWNYRPKFLFLGSKTTRPKHLELFRKELKATLDCCTGNSFKCWRHYLKDVHEMSSKEIEAQRRRYDPYFAQSHEAICLKLDWESDWECDS